MEGTGCSNNNRENIKPDCCFEYSSVAYQIIITPNNKHYAIIVLKTLMQWYWCEKSLCR